MNCSKWNVHSANPVGAENIFRAMQNAGKYSRGDKNARSTKIPKIGKNI